MTIFDEDQRFRQLVQHIVPGGTLARSWQLAGGISAGMTALEIEMPGGRSQRMIVRRPSQRTLERNPRAAGDEHNLLRITQALGLPTQAPLYLDHSGTIFPTPYLVIEYVDGEPDFAPANLNDAMRQMAGRLADIHRADVSGLDLRFLVEQHADAAGVLGVRPTGVDRSLDEGRIRDALERAWPEQRNAPALLHGDYWPGNLLWRDGRLVAVIDWEDATRGDPLIDLAISRLDIAWIFGPAAMDAFTEHYASRMAIDYIDLAYWDLVAALRLVRLAGPDLAAWAAFFGPFGRPDITEQTIRHHYGMFVARAFERLVV